MKVINYIILGAITFLSGSVEAYQSRETNYSTSNRAKDGENGGYGNGKNGENGENGHKGEQGQDGGHGGNGGSSDLGYVDMYLPEESVNIWKNIIENPLSREDNLKRLLKVAQIINR